MGWYKDWFNTRYYHILYKDRDYKEANKFITNLVNKLHISPDSCILDLACGKGRHSIYLNALGFNVEGVDLSVKSISKAKEYESARLHFATHDMRDVYKADYFDYVFNLFTSFGYFESEEENQKVVDAMAANLKAGGQLVIDFLNVDKAIKNLQPKEVKEIEGIVFNITKAFKNNAILKNIQFIDNEKEYSYTESVKALYQNDFEKYFSKSGLKIVDVFGDYELNSFELKSSDRLIFVCEK